MGKRAQFTDSRGETITGEWIERHVDFAEPMNTIVRDDNGRTAMLKDGEFSFVEDPRRITRVNFTYAMMGGMWIERANGSRNWESTESLLAELGQDELSRLSKIAHANGMCGMWYNADNGRICHVNGELVN